MESGSVTTPFGRRAMTLGMLASQQIAQTMEPGISRNKWKLFRAVCEARPTLGVSDRALTVLDALLTFYPGDELSEEKGLIVFPSNAQLSIRARGMTAATLRRHLAGLVEAGLIVRKDSANGKRFARRDGAGEVQEAFGFSIAPLLARAAEIETIAAQALADREFYRATKERLTICRRDVAKLISVAMEEGAPGDWNQVASMFREIVTSLPRTAGIDHLLSALDEMALLREEIVNRLEMLAKTSKIDAKESQIERHIHNSNPESSYDLEPAFEDKQAGKSVDRLDDRRELPHGNRRDEGGALKSFPLGLVLQACPQIADYGPGGQIGSWRDLMSAAIVVRTMLGVSPSAYQEACAAMGPESAATVMAYILERGGHINSAGGYLRDLTRKTQAGNFSIGPMLMSLVRGNSPLRQRAS